jgi:hypothetical protein
MHCTFPDDFHDPAQFGPSGSASPKASTRIATKVRRVGLPVLGPRYHLEV